MNRSSWPTGSLRDRVTRAIDEVRPAIRADGGDVELVAIEGSVVLLHLTGACRGCPMAASTLSEFVAERVQLYAPEITEVVAV